MTTLMTPKPELADVLEEWNKQALRIAELEAALREIAEGDIDDGGYRRNHISATAIARRVLGLSD